MASPEEFFADDPVGLAVHRRVLGLLDESVEVRVSRSQVAFRVAFPQPVASPRWKEVVHPSPRTWMHHLEVRDVGEVDDEVAGWLRAARDAAA